jgi:hypothetical protein
VVSSARYHGERGLQIESTWATLVLVLERFGLVEAEIEEAYGAVQVAGRLPTVLASVALPATILLVAIPTVAVIARRWRPARGEVGANCTAGDDSGMQLEHAELAVVLGCMIAAKVLSPQFVLWVAPLLALVATGPAGAGLAFLTAALTTQVYPDLYPALMDQTSGNGHALLVLAARRNALLIGWYVLAVWRLAKQSTPWRRLEGGAGTLPGPILPLRPRCDPPPGR